MLSGAESPGRSPISIATLWAPSASATASPTATRPWRTMISGAMVKPSARSDGHGLSENIGTRAGERRAPTIRRQSRMRRHNRHGARPTQQRRSAQGDGRDRGASGKSADPPPRWRSKAPDDRVRPVPPSSRASSSGVMHGVARTGMSKPEIEERGGRQRRAGALKPDARCRKPPQRTPNVGRRLITADNARSMDLAAAAGECDSLRRSSLGGRARLRIPAPGGDRTDRAWRARRETTSTGSRA